MDTENFPRGGKKIINTDTTKRKHDDNLFYVEKHQNLKRPRKERSSKNKDVNHEELWQASLQLQGTLTYNKMHEGLIVQCCIRHVSNLALQVEFPGLTFGVVTINCVSDAFTQFLARKLKEDNENSCIDAIHNIIGIGELVPAKIMSVTETEKGYKVNASINPRDINADKAHYSFRRGALVWSNVVSELDHGYELSFGVSSCRVFLPHKYIDEGVTYEIGKPLYCVIQKIETSSAASTLTVSTKRNHVEKNQYTAEISLSDVIPGMQVEFSVQQVTSHGIKGQFLDDCFGYIDQSQFFSKVKTADLEEGTTLTAYVLFVEPITKITYLTLRGLERLPEPEYESGKIMTSQIVSVVPRGVYLKLGKHNRGFVSNKRLLNTLPKNAQTDISEAIQKKYSVGSRQECRVLNYNRMEQLYVCTFEKRILQEKVFNVKDLSIGDKVVVKIEKILENGFLVKAGQVQGFVPNLHISYAKFSEKIKAKFAVGMDVDARVLNMENNSILFTLKQALINSETCVSNVKEVKFRAQYEGVVVQTKMSGALVAFYGNVTGWLSNKMLNLENTGKYCDPREYFFRGQVVTVYVLGVKNWQLLVSLRLPSNKPKKAIKVGDTVTGTITNVDDTGVDVEVGPNKLPARVPLAHLSPVSAFCPVLLKLYKAGRQIKKLMCIRNADSYVMSRREAIIYDKSSLTVPKLRGIRKNMTLRCSVVDKLDNGILVSTPIKDYADNIIITDDNIKRKRGEVPVFENEQNIIAKVVSVDCENKKIDLLVQTQNDKINAQDAVDNLCNVIGELNHIVYYHSSRKCSNLTEYKIGQRVVCTVERTDNDGTQWVKLPNGVIGRVASGLALNAAVGTSLEGVILDYDFLNGHVEICTKKSLKQAVNTTQDGFIKKSLNTSGVVKILLVTKLYVLAVFKGGECNRQLVYLPLELFKSAKNKNKIKIVISRRVGSKLIAVPKKYFTALSSKSDDKKMKKVVKKVKTVEVIEAINEIGNDVKSEDETEAEDINEEDVQYETSYSNSEKGRDEIKDNEEENEIEIKEEPEDIKEYEEQDEDMDSEEQDEIKESEEERDEVKDEIKESEEEREEINENEEEQDEDKAYLQDNVLVDNIDKKPLLSGAQSFYALNNDVLVKEESSSDEEETNEDMNKKKKKLTKAERGQMAKEEEERISKIERELADATLAPQNTEQFDRLLLANPNSSELWLQYMAMHVATTELEKARAVARKALDTINMTLVKEKFNVWIALLNLENMYGTKESFEKVFEDAVKYNDSLEIYLSVIKMLATSGKLVEMEEKIKKVKSKEKQNTKMWVEVGQVYYSLAKNREARNIKEAALKSILDKKRQFDLIVRFGIMEFQLGEFEQAVANFETILDTYPAKTNIWIIYVDQLVKLKKIEAARKVLERAVAQRLGLKQMKALFQKFVAFEEQHGTSERVEDVKQRAREYVTNLSAN